MSEAAKPRSSDGPTIAPLVAAIGETVRSIRRERTLTLEQLAEASGLSVGVISQLERGIGNPAFATLVQLAHALDVPVGRLLLRIEDNKSPIVRKTERRRVGGHGLATAAATYELLTPDLSGALEATWVTSQPGHDTSKTPFTHNGEEFGIVLSGSLDVFVDGVRHHLEAGDSIRYSSTIPHWYVNAGDEPAQCIWVSTPPTW
ncbi:helix-turn-helix domain-containing protein [Streptomyces sp. NPDC101149]|uniref:helix-turn-helix domain-containing protein n=1 Tax=Streptomyces sp. NPDC101149 TaxID=3366113 RepID=UPI003829CDE7